MSVENYGRDICVICVVGGVDEGEGEGWYRTVVPFVEFSLSEIYMAMEVESRELQLFGG